MPPVHRTGDDVRGRPPLRQVLQDAEDGRPPHGHQGQNDRGGTRPQCHRVRLALPILLFINLQTCQVLRIDMLSPCPHAPPHPLSPSSPLTVTVTLPLASPAPQRPLPRTRRQWSSCTERMTTDLLVSVSRSLYIFMSLIPDFYICNQIIRAFKFHFNTYVYTHVKCDPLGIAGRCKCTR